MYILEAVFCYRHHSIFNIDLLVSDQKIYYPISSLTAFKKLADDKKFNLQQKMSKIFKKLRQKLVQKAQERRETTHETQYDQKIETRDTITYWVRNLIDRVWPTFSTSGVGAANS